MLAIHSRFEEYQEQLQTSGWSKHSIRVYASRVRLFIEYYAQRLGCSDESGGHGPLQDAIDAYLDHLQLNMRLTASSLNSYSTSLLHFLQFLGVDEFRRSRSYCSPSNKRMLTEDEFRRYIKTAEEKSGFRDLALVGLICLAGLKPSQCISLNVADLIIVDDTSCEADSFKRPKLELKVGAKHVLLPSSMADVVLNWLSERKQFIHGKTEDALFITRKGTRMTVATVDYLIRNIGFKCHLVVSARILNNTYRSLQNNQSVVNSDLQIFDAKPLVLFPAPYRDLPESQVEPIVAISTTGALLNNVV